MPRRAWSPASLQKQRQGAQLRRGDEIQRGLLLGQQIVAGALFIAVLTGALVDLLLHQWGQHQPGQMALQVIGVVAVSSATTLVSPTRPCLAAT